MQKQLTEEQTEFFFDMLNARINDFETALKEKQESYEREQIIEQYNRFAKTLFHCLSKPQSTLFIQIIIIIKNIILLELMR